ncbi:hypothetical protein GCM10027405_34120 [Arthrobacter alkaliphilus]
MAGAEAVGLGVELIVALADADGEAPSVRGAAVGLSADGFPGTVHAPNPAARDVPSKPSAARRLTVEGWSSHTGIPGLEEINALGRYQRPVNGK